eukprot:2407574-Alexandrium_andersonii.AAC.4
MEAPSIFGSSVSPRPQSQIAATKRNRSAILGGAGRRSPIATATTTQSQHAITGTAAPKCAIQSLRPSNPIARHSRASHSQAIATTEGTLSLGGGGLSSPNEPNRPSPQLGIRTHRIPNLTMQS